MGLLLYIHVSLVVDITFLHFVYVPPDCPTFLNFLFCGLKLSLDGGWLLSVFVYISICIFILRSDRFLDTTQISYLRDAPMSYK
jgi:hypothetical protein